MEKQGTEWTEPGQGATAHQLWMLAKKMNEGRCADHDPLRIGEGIKTAQANLYRIQKSRHRTNLKLTGAPLTAEDLARIASAK